MMLRDRLSLFLASGEEKITRADLATCLICVAVALSALTIFVT